MSLRIFPLLAVLSFSPMVFGAEQDALAIDANIQARHMPYGTIMDPMLSLPDLTQIVDYTRCGDSAIRTGHYLAAEAFRYTVTGSADALNNIKNAIGAIDNLIEVTGGNVLARCGLPANSPYAASIATQEAANGIYNGNIFGAPWIWVGNTSRDQYIGIFFGLTVTYDMVSDQSVRNWCSYLITRLLQNLLDNVWNVVMPDGAISTTFLIRPDERRRFREDLLGRVECPVAHRNGSGGSGLHQPDQFLLQVQSGLSDVLHLEANGQRLFFLLVRARLRRTAHHHGEPSKCAFQHDRPRNRWPELQA
jgi:hypothetical protein